MRHPKSSEYRRDGTESPRLHHEKETEDVVLQLSLKTSDPEGNMSFKPWPLGQPYAGLKSRRLHKSRNGAIRPSHDWLDLETHSHSLFNSLNPCRRISYFLRDLVLRSAVTCHSRSTAPIIIAELSDFPRTGTAPSLPISLGLHAFARSIPFIPPSTPILSLGLKAQSTSLDTFAYHVIFRQDQRQTSSQPIQRADLDVRFRRHWQ